MATRIVIMKDGVIQQVGSPQEVYDKPINRFVGGFIGSPAMNFVKGVIVEEQDETYFKVEKMSIQIPFEKAKMLKELGYLGQELYLGIRPEDIYEDLSAVNSSSSTTFRATVETIELTGAERFVHMSIGEQTLVARLKSRSHFAMGSVAKLVFDPDKIHFFDIDSEIRIEV